MRSVIRGSALTTVATSYRTSIAHPLVRELYTYMQDARETDGDGGDLIFVVIYVDLLLLSESMGIALPTGKEY